MSIHVAFCWSWVHPDWFKQKKTSTPVQVWHDMIGSCLAGGKGCLMAIHKGASLLLLGHALVLWSVSDKNKFCHPLMDGKSAMRHLFLKTAAHNQCSWWYWISISAMIGSEKKKKKNTRETVWVWLIEWLIEWVNDRLNESLWMTERRKHEEKKVSSIYKAVSAWADIVALRTLSTVICHSLPLQRLGVSNWWPYCECYHGNPGHNRCQPDQKQH